VPGELEGRALVDFNGRVRRRIDDLGVTLPDLGDVTTGELGPAVAPPAERRPVPSLSGQSRPTLGADKPRELAGAFVAIAVRGRSPRRELEVVKPSRYRVRSRRSDEPPGYSETDDCAHVEVWQIRVSVPHVPDWLVRAVRHALETHGTVLDVEDGEPQLVLDVDAFCGLVESTAQRLRAAAIDRATFSVDATVEASVEGDAGSSADLAISWAEVLESLPRESREPGSADTALRGAKEASVRLGDRVDPALAGAITDALELPSGPIRGDSNAERIEAACAVIERLIGAEHVGEVTGLTWS
jgi:hypothetical protein